jgi:hypothetical protein
VFVVHSTIPESLVALKKQWATHLLEQPTQQSICFLFLTLLTEHFAKRVVCGAKFSQYFLTDMSGSGKTGHILRMSRPINYFRVCYN